jgi:uncharacterized protein YqfB (UPF0267 family)
VFLHPNLKLCYTMKFERKLPIGVPSSDKEIRENEIHFSSNRNNKLSNELSFTDFRPDSAGLCVGKKYRVLLKKKFLFRVTILDKRTMELEQVNEWIARIDSGVSLEEFKKAIHLMYPQKEKEPKMTFCFLLMLKEY